MALSERLAIIISANGAQAMAEFNKVGKSAERSLATTEQRAQRLGAQFTRVGAGAVVFGAVLAAGMFKAAQAAGEQEAANLRLENTMANQPDARESVLTDSRSDQKLERPRMWRVLLHNDDWTTQEFVVWILETIFHKPRGEAFAIMMSVHRSGVGLAGVYTHDVAETKLKAARSRAEEHEFPLLVTMEPEPENP